MEDPSRRPRQELITEPKLLLTEGADAYWFSKWAVSGYALSRIQVIDFGGNQQLETKLTTLQRIPGYHQVEALGIIRDAESNASAAVESVQLALERAKLTVPDNAFEVKSGSPKVGIFLFPGPGNGEKTPRPGTLEDFCLFTVKGKPVMSCIDSFLDCVKDVGCDVRHPHKASLHAYLTANDKFVGMKLGEAGRAGAWDWEHPAFRAFKEFLYSL